MPTYDYLCESCDFEFEQFQSITAKPIRKCPRCGKLSLKRLIGVGAGIIFKGSGFYQTDYRSDSYKKAEKKDKEVPAEKKETSKNKDSKTSEKSKSDTKSKKKPA